MNKDLISKEENKIYNFRTSGILILNGKILIQRGETDTEYALPGGQVKFGETGAEAIVREYKEEIGIDINAERLIWVEEVFWKWNETDCHTICFYYLLNIKNPECILSKGETFKSQETDESRLIFKWVSLNDVKNYTIYPTFLKDKINNISNGIEHFIYKE